MRHFQVRVLATFAVAAFALAACGSSSKTSSPSNSTASTASTTTVAPTTTTVSPAAASVKVATTPLGKVLVDANGLTLYRFDNDTVPGKSACTDTCSLAWPAATVTGVPAAGAGIDASKLTTLTRPDGSTQMQIAGHPLYRFAGDTKPGDTKGEGVINKWYASSPDGNKT